MNIKDPFSGQTSNDGGASTSTGDIDCFRAGRGCNKDIQVSGNAGIVDAGNGNGIIPGRKGDIHNRAIGFIIGRLNGFPQADLSIRAKTGIQCRDAGHIAAHHIGKSGCGHRLCAARAKAQQIQQEDEEEFSFHLIGRFESLCSENAAGAPRHLVPIRLSRVVLHRRSQTRAGRSTALQQ